MKGREVANRINPTQPTTVYSQSQQHREKFVHAHRTDKSNTYNCKDIHPIDLLLISLIVPTVRMVLTRRTGVGHAKGAARGSMQLAPLRGPTSFLSLILLLILATLTLAPRVCFGQTSLELTESEPTDGFVAYNTAAYFKISLPNPFPDQAERVTINVTPLGDGNPDCQ